MKEIKKVGALVAIFIFNFYNICFADVIWRNPETGEWVRNGTGGVGKVKQPDVPEIKPINYVLIGIIVLVVVVCAVFIIRTIIKKKKEKENDNNNK